MAECIRCGKEREDEHYMMCLDCFRFITGNKTRLPWEEAGDNNKKKRRGERFKNSVPCKVVEVEQIKEGEATSDDIHILVKVMYVNRQTYTHLFYRKVREWISSSKVEAEKSVGCKGSKGTMVDAHIKKGYTMRPYKGKYFFERANQNDTRTDCRRNFTLYRKNE